MLQHKQQDLWQKVTEIGRLSQSAIKCNKSSAAVIFSREPGLEELFPNKVETILAIGDDQQKVPSCISHGSACYHLCDSRLTFFWFFPFCNPALRSLRIGRCTDATDPEIQ
jgi:hypothetical protein